MNLTESFSNNKRDFWRLTRYFVKKNTASCSIPPLCTLGDDNVTKLHTTDKEKANCLNEYFTSVSRVSDENTQLPNFQKITNCNLDTIIITENEVKEIIDLLNINKASGPDLINHKMLKYVSTAVSKPLTIIFNWSLQEKHYPEPWKKNNVVPSFKKGDKSDSSNYRPVSLSSLIGRQSVLHCRIRNFCSNLHNDLFHNHLRYNPFCDCLEEIEDAEHYFFRCRRFIDQRLSLFHKTRHLHPLNTNLLLSGNLNISYNDNVLLFEAVQKYIKDTARFDT